MKGSAVTDLNPAVVYDTMFVPALFAQWGPRVADAAGILPGQRVLDIGCGTGVLAIAAAERAGSSGYVVGLDPNPQMIEVARGKPSNVVWQLGRAETLPFENASFDAVVSQFAMMLFKSKRTTIEEMLRVLKPGGRLAIAVLDQLGRSPGYDALTTLLGDLFGDEIAGAMRAPFSLGDRQQLSVLFSGAGADDIDVRPVTGTARFASIDAMIGTERACLWTLGGLLDDTQFDKLRLAAQQSLRSFVRPDGSVEFECSVLVVTATKR